MLWCLSPISVLDLSLYLHSTVCRWPKLPAVLRAVQCLVSLPKESCCPCRLCVCGRGGNEDYSAAVHYIWGIWKVCEWSFLLASLSGKVSERSFTCFTNASSTCFRPAMWLNFCCLSPSYCYYVFSAVNSETFSDVDRHPGSPVL